ncbi:DegV domain-containing protein [Candidatus Izimaplasma bacterium HR1]|jgi:DegV family protein with EDD domain|uniref:DegV family protein n=1 Tax=Candidatus Izimoplasma sp. HR1 TaxID=1541959 RepID=UPI0004F8DEF4|nr:DegV domain-containing protein [Candidatus Izimaplasma bacterium HR1]
MKIGIITDSASNLDLKFIEKHKNLIMTPLMISFEGEFHRDIIEVDYETVYKKLETTKVTTSLPSLEDFQAAIKKFEKEGYTDILVITISSNLSGTFQAFEVAAKDHEGANLHFYDTKTLSAAEGDLVKVALDSIEQGRSIPRIIADLNQVRYEDSVALFTVETLRYLREGGRIGKVEGTIGDLLNVKPVITVTDEGVYNTITKGFGMKRTMLAMRKVLKEKYKDDPISITIHYGNNLEKAQSLKDKLESGLNTKEVIISQLTPVLGIHTGPEMYAIIARRVK